MVRMCLANGGTHAVLYKNDAFVRGTHRYDAMQDDIVRLRSAIATIEEKIRARQAEVPTGAV